MNIQDIELIEALLDGELDPSAATELKDRIERDADLSTLLNSLKEERELRKSSFNSFEPTQEKADEIALAVCKEARRAGMRRWVQMRSMFKIVGSVAACVVVGFGVGWMSRGAYQKPVEEKPQVPEYLVRITDEKGAVISDQKFSSADQARQFAEDLQNWQQQQAQLRNAYMVVRTGAF